MVPGWAVIHTFSSTRPQLEAVGLTAEPCGIWDNSVLSGLLWTWAPLRSAPGVTTETECLATTSANAARQLMSLGMMVTSFGVDGAEENAYKFSTAVHLAVCPGPVAISSHRALSLSTWGILTTEETVKEAGMTVPRALLHVVRRLCGHDDVYIPRVRNHWVKPLPFPKWLYHFSLL
ncbi:histone H1.1 isoform X2 [Mustela putorius furo]|uniref:Histone H1.1 isoform X2 n=1 Tax=Mustela putorius furo TaxID=9669 RepID=A0A8U0S842_MUSPF|nr:histone H1.1 isoform X2 [Mustela putorius furo]